MTHDPLVSILINNYNYGRFLGEAIESALGQSYRQIEVVVVDDGSTDNSREVIASYGKLIVPVIKKNGGQASAYNAGFAASTGDIVCILDSDDLFTPGKVARLVEIFKQDPDIGWCFDRVHEFENETLIRHPPMDTDAFGKWDKRAITAAGKPPCVPTASSGFSFRRETLSRILPMPERVRISGGSGADKYLSWVALLLKEGWLAQEELTLQRIHGNNTYTRRKEGKTHLKGQYEVSTAMYMYESFPALRSLAVKIFSLGLGKLFVHGGIEPEYKAMVRPFLRSLTLPARAEVALRVMYWSAFEYLLGK